MGGRRKESDSLAAATDDDDDPIKPQREMIKLTYRLLLAKGHKNNSNTNKIINNHPITTCTGWSIPIQERRRRKHRI